MDLVCVTDHDSIDGGLELLERRPDADDVIVGEEITCRLPDGESRCTSRAYDMTEALHRDVQHLRGNVFDVTARLREAGVFFALNHLLHFYRDQLPLERYLELLDEVPALEVRNGTMLPAHNELCERWSLDDAGHADRAWSRDWRQRRAHAAARRHDLDGGAGHDARGVPEQPEARPRPARRRARRRCASSPAMPTVWSARTSPRSPASGRATSVVAPRRVPGVCGRVAADAVHAARWWLRRASRRNGGSCATVTAALDVVRRVRRIADPCVPDPGVPESRVPSPEPSRSHRLTGSPSPASA